VNDCFRIFYTILNKILDKHTPLKTSPVSKFRNCWVNLKILKLSKIKNNLFKKLIKNPTNINLTNYKSFRNHFTKIKRFTEKSFYENKFNESKCDIKIKWQLIDETLNNRIRCSQINLLYNNNITITNKLEIANAFNENFFKTVDGLQNGFCKNISQNQFKIHAESNANSIFLENTNPSEIISITNSFKSKKSTSNDNFNMFLTKLFINETVAPLTYLFNLSLTNGIFPDLFKIAKVVAVYKKGNRGEASNYRPISLLSPFSKILEKIVSIRINSFLSKHNILSNKQYGLRSAHSTELANLELIQNVLSNMNDKKLTLGIFLDLTKAFDLINNSLLLKKTGS